MATGTTVTKIKRKAGHLYFVDGAGNVKEKAMKRGGAKKKATAKKKPAAKKKAAPKKKAVKKASTRKPAVKKKATATKRKPATKKKTVAGSPVKARTAMALVAESNAKGKNKIRFTFPADYKQPAIILDIRTKLAQTMNVLSNGHFKTATWTS